VLGTGIPLNLIRISRGYRRILTVEDVSNVGLQPGGAVVEMPGISGFSRSGIPHAFNNLIIPRVIPRAIPRDQ
jgi:hypothetical protein